MINFISLCSPLHARERRPEQTAGYLFVHRLGFGAWRVLIRVDPDIAHRTLSRLGNRFPCPLHRWLNLARLGNFFAISTNHLAKLGKRHVAEFVSDITTVLTVLGELSIADLIHS